MNSKLHLVVDLDVIVIVIHFLQETGLYRPSKLIITYYTVGLNVWFVMECVHLAQKLRGALNTSAYEKTLSAPDLLCSPGLISGREKKLCCSLQSFNTMEMSGPSEMQL